MAKSAKKGRRDAEDAEACVVGSVITLPLVVALVIALSFEAIRQLPSASVFDHKEGRDAGLMHVMTRSAKNGRCDAEDAADEIRRENGEKNHSTLPEFFILHSSFFIYYIGDGRLKEAKFGTLPP